MKKIIGILIVTIFVLTGCANKTERVKADANEYYASLTKDIESNDAAVESWMEDTTVEIKDDETRAVFELFTTLRYGFTSMEETNEAINEMRVDFAKSTDYRIGDVKKGDEKGTYDVHMYFNPVSSTAYVLDAFNYQYNMYEEMVRAVQPDWTEAKINETTLGLMEGSITVSVVKIGDKVYTINWNQYRDAVSQMLYYDQWLEEGSMMSDVWFEEDIEFTKVDGKYIPTNDIGVDFENQNPEIYLNYYFLTQEQENDYIDENPDLFDSEGNNTSEIPAAI